MLLRDVSFFINLEQVAKFGHQPFDQVVRGVDLRFGIAFKCQLQRCLFLLELLELDLIGGALDLVVHQPSSSL